jgi:hypothetical protein
MAKGYFDPKRNDHVSIFLDILSSAFVLWAVMGRDIRRFYEPTLDKTTFEKTLRYYFWGGKESYEIRQKLRELSAPNATQSTNKKSELPFWEDLVNFSGLIVAAPQSVLGCAYLCRELSIKVACDPNVDFDIKLSSLLKENSHIRQFSVSLGDYLVHAGMIPSDLAKRVQEIIFDL